MESFVFPTVTVKPTGSAASCGIVKLWHPQIADLKLRTGLKNGDLRLRAAPVDGFRRAAGGKDRRLHAFGARQHGQAIDMVAMLVGDEDAVQALGIFADGFEAGENLLPVQPRVDQDAVAGLAMKMELPALEEASTQILTMAALLTLPW